MKRERRPPGNWRRNMAAAAVFLAILDFLILSPGLDSTRVVLALGVTLVVGLSILATWRSNSRFEQRPPEGKTKNRRQEGRNP